MLQYRLDKESLNILGNELRNKPLEFLSLSNKYVIDLGGNTGKFALPLKTQNNKIISIDINRSIMVDGNGKSLLGIELIQGNILSLPFKNNTFDIVLARAILHHVPNQLDMAFSEVERILRPGGIMLIEEPGYHNPIAFIMRKAFPTTSHEEGENSLKISVLKSLSNKYFTIKEIKYFWLFSYTIPHLISRLPKSLKSVARILLRGLVRIDEMLLKLNICKKFCGYVMIVAQKKGFTINLSKTFKYEKPININYGQGYTNVKI